jgi:hypothetical protein
LKNPVILAYYFGTNTQPGLISINTFLYNIEGGFSVPYLPLYFRGATKVDCTTLTVKTVVDDVKSELYYALYFTDDNLEGEEGVSRGASHMLLCHLTDDN